MPVAAERAIDELRRGRAVIVEGGERLAVLPVELAGADALAAFEGDGRADLLITDKRAAQLSLANQRAAAGMAAVRLARPPWIDADGAVAVADPTLDLAAPFKGPFETLPVSDEAGGESCAAGRQVRGAAARAAHPRRHI